MHEIDRAVKKICAWHPNCFLDLFYGRERTVSLQGVEDTQLQIPEHRTDKFWRVKDGAKEACLMLEAVTEPDRRDYPRINLKTAAARITLKKPVITVLVYLQKGKYATFPAGYQDEIGGLVNKYSFARVLLWEHADRIKSGELKELAPFLPLFEEDPDPEILALENELLESVEDPEERLELKSVGVIIAARKFSEELIQQYLKLEFPMIRETTIFSEWLDQERKAGWADGLTKGQTEGHTKGRTEGLTEGLAEGLTEGLVEGKRLVLNQLLEKKFGVLPKRLKTAFQKLKSEQLDALTMALLDLKTLGDLMAWLKRSEIQIHKN